MLSLMLIADCRDHSLGNRVYILCPLLHVAWFGLWLSSLILISYGTVRELPPVIISQRISFRLGLVLGGFGLVACPG